MRKTAEIEALIALVEQGGAHVVDADLSLAVSGPAHEVSLTGGRIPDGDYMRASLDVLIPVKPVSRTVEITLKGGSGSGKSTLLHGIGRFLLDKGIAVTCYDEGERVAPFGFLPGELDDRAVVIKID